MAALDAAASLRRETSLGLSPVRPLRQHSGGVGRGRVNVRDVHLLAVVVVVVVAVVVDMPLDAAGDCGADQTFQSRAGRTIPRGGLSHSESWLRLAQDARLPGSG